MADIHIHRAHALGLAKARKLAWRWAEEAEKKFSLECTVIEGAGSDTVEFVGSGVKGRLLVAADQFDLQARLGLLLGAFGKKIESEIEQQIDALLGGAPVASSEAAAAAAPKDRNAPKAPEAPKAAPRRAAARKKP